SSAAPYYNWALRWGKKVSDKFAFKTGFEFIKATDWAATDYRNLLRNNVYSSIKSGTRETDPNYDGVNVFGDEASAGMGSFAQAVRAQVAAGGGSLINSTVDAMVAGGMTPQTIATNFATNPALAPYAAYLPFLIPTSAAPNNAYKNTFGSQYVSRTGYLEKDLVDYGAYNIKLSGGLYYKITNNLEASLLAYWGTGTTVYTGADRYAIKNLKMGQYKLELKSKNWFIRGYTTQENSGDAYTATTAAVAINRAWKSDQNWFQQYTGTYGAAMLGILPNPAGGFLPQFNDPTAHATARSIADAGRLLPGTTGFQDAFNNAVSTPISKGGAKFADATDMYHYEGQLNLTDYVKFAEVLVGANYRKFVLNSHGTIFSDTTGHIGIHELGGYLQISKWVVNQKLKLTLSGRYDKSQNFEGRFTPRATALLKLAANNYLRLSYQQAYRFPSTQDQWINLRTPASILIGGLPDFITFYNFNNSPAYTAESIVAYRNSVNTGTPNPTLLQVASFKTVKPEISNSYEFGYRGLLSKHFMVDGYVYYSQYKDFIAREAVGRGQSASTNQTVSLTELASPFTTTNYSFVTNSTQAVKAAGWGLSLDYKFDKGLALSANISGDALHNVPAGLVTFFNTPKARFNIGVSHDKIAQNWGFSIMYRWQDHLYWEGTFGTGEIPAYGTLDGQVSYKIP
ncbi:MAG: TonB-dependent receptor, partial [Bacteroidetes bacterium]|nr:TonB-dependent receptor [Bacteroidota bacterium]